MRTKIAISAICGLLGAAHLIWPNLEIDVVTIILLVVAILPWFAGVVQSVEFPGGFKIELQEVKAATEKVTAIEAVTGAPPPPPTRDENFEFLREISRSNPNLALVALRIEIERRLLRFAQQTELPSVPRSAGAMLRDLTRHERIDRQTAAGLGDLIALGNQAAHGAEVSPNAAMWALDKGPGILERLDSLLEATS